MYIIILEGSGGSWSMIGSTAKFVEKGKPTMVIKLRKGMSSEEITATINHQFGHALGFGHVLMKQSEWDILNTSKFVDQRKMMKSYGVDDLAKFEVQWTGKGMPESGFNCSDDNSVMQFRYVM